jgi:hypothetical protein
MRLPVGGAMRKFLDKLGEGDPVAIGLFGFVVLLAVVAGGIWLVDRRNQQKEKEKANGKGSGRKSR